MNPTLARYGLFYPVRILRGEPFYSAVREIRKNRLLTAEQLVDKQLDLLRGQITNAMRNVPFYRDLYREYGVNPERVLGPADVASLPMISKEDIRNNRERFRSEKRLRKDSRSTSGSTGVPLSFEKDRASTAWMDAVMYTSYAWHGIPLGAAQARFWGVPLKPGARFEAAVKDLLMNRIRLSAFTADAASFESFGERLQRFRPVYFYGYPSLMHEFARYILAERPKWVENLGLKAVIGTGELVVESHCREIEEAFGALFVNEYGCTEAGVIAFECEEGNLHVASDHLLVEVVDDSGRPVIDQEGEIVLSELHADTFPFIRYRIGDRGALSSAPCSCGKNLPVLKIMSGRKDSYILTPSGRRVYDAILAYTLKKGVAAFRAVQYDTRNVEVLVCKDAAWRPEMLQEYSRVLAEKTFNEVDFHLKLVASLPRERSGKLRYFTSRIKTPMGGVTGEQ